MDPIIATLPVSQVDEELTMCEDFGVAYQTDMMAGRVEYGADYLAKVDAYDGNEVSKAVNAGRCAMMSRLLSPGSSVFDIGAGSGAFIREARHFGFKAYGDDVIPEARLRLRELGYLDDGSLQGEYDAVTAWDVLEHMEHPKDALCGLLPGTLLFASIPIFRDLRGIRSSKHYRPGEHLYYFTAQGFVDWMVRQGFAPIYESDHETRAGRESIGAFAFRREP
jgi:SAM-dependent methyltransferase